MLWFSKNPKKKLTPPLTTDMTRVVTNLVAQMALEVPAALMDQEDQVVPAGPVALKDLEEPMVLGVWADLATTLPMSKISCQNS